MENIDNKIKQLADHQSIPPPSFVWDNIENSLRPKKKKRGIIWLFLGLFLLTCSLIWILSENTIPSFHEENITVAGSEKQDDISDILPITTNKEATIEISNPSKLANSSKIQVKNYIPGKTNNSLLSIKKLKIINQLNVQKPVSNNSEPTIVKDFRYTESEAVLKPESKNTSIESFQKMASILEIERLSTHLDYERSLVKLNKIIECPSFDKNKKISTFFEIGGLLGTHFKTINDGSNENLASLRRESESSWYTYGFYGVAGINITPSFYLGVGVDWTQSKDKFYSAQDAITKMIITFDPNTGIPIDTSLVTGNLVNQGEIKYTSIDIPVTVGFTRSYQTWDFGVELGGVMNLNFSSDGKIFSESEHVSYLNKESDVYKSKLGFGLKTSLLVRKNLKNGMSIQLKPTFRTYFNEINVDGYNLPINYSVFGINMGLRKDF